MNSRKVLLVSPRAARCRRLATQRLSRQLDRQLPAEWESVLDMERVVRAGYPPTVRVPEVVVARVGGPEERLAASEVLPAVEVISPGSRNVDLHLEPCESAEAGVPHYWIGDLDPPAPSITVFHLGAPGDGYVEAPARTGELVATAPFDLRVDIPALVAPRS